MRMVTLTERQERQARGERIVAERARLRLSRGAVAERADCTESGVAYAEAGMAGPDLLRRVEVAIVALGGALEERAR